LWLPHTDGVLRKCLALASRCAFSFSDRYPTAAKPSFPGRNPRTLDEAAGLRGNVSPGKGKNGKQRAADSSPWTEVKNLQPCSSRPHPMVHWFTQTLHQIANAQSYKGMYNSADDCCFFCHKQTTCTIRAVPMILRPWCEIPNEAIY